jgi:anti-sigma-K factor RskA
VSPPDRFTDDVGAYLLGALEPSERDAFEHHLDGCEECRDEVVRLSPARDALPRSVDQMAPPPSLKASLMETVRAEAARDAAPAPRRSRWREALLARPAFAAAAAAVLLAVGIGAGVLVGAPGGGDDGARTVAAVVDGTRMPSGEASLVLPEDGEDGAQLRVEGMQPPPEGKVYEVWIKRGTRVTPSSLFTVDSEGNGTAAIPEDVHDADAVMVTREREGGARTPSEPPVMTVSVPS